MFKEKKSEESKEKEKKKHIVFKSHFNGNFDNPIILSYKKQKCAKLWNVKKLRAKFIISREVFHA